MKARFVRFSAGKAFLLTLLFQKGYLETVKSVKFHGTGGFWTKLVVDNFVQKRAARGFLLLLLFLYREQ
jgi:hypothetical protein